MATRFFSNIWQKLCWRKTYKRFIQQDYVFLHIHDPSIKIEVIVELANTMVVKRQKKCMIVYYDTNLKEKDYFKAKMNKNHDVHITFLPMFMNSWAPNYPI